MGGAFGALRLLNINFISKESKKYKNTTKIKWLTQKYNKNQMTHYICWGLEDLKPIWTLRTSCSNLEYPQVPRGIYTPILHPYCRWKGFCITWLAGAPSHRVQKFILRPCLQNLFDTIFIQSFTDPYQKWKGHGLRPRPQNVVGVAFGHPHHILGILSFLVGVCETLYKNCIK